MTNSAVNPATTNDITIARSSDIFQIYLVDEEGQNILSIDDGAQRQSLRVEIVNTSGRTIALKDLDGNLSTNYHFCISFRPGTLVEQGKDATLAVQDGQDNEIKGWQIGRAADDNKFFLRLDKSGTAAAKAIVPGQRITLVLGNIGAAPAGGSRGTRVEIRLSNLQYRNTNQENTNQDIPNQTRLQYLNIVNQRGKKQIPLYAGFLGSNTILNDNSENELTLSIQSLPRQNLPLIIKPYSSDRFENLQNVTSRQTSFGKTVLDLLQKLPNFQNFLITTMNTAIDAGMPDNTPLSRIHGDPVIIQLFTNQTSQIIQRIRQIIKQSIESIIRNGDINKFLDGQKTVKDLVWRDNQQAFLDAIFDSNSTLIDLFNRLRLDKLYVLDLIPDNVANLKPYQVIREANDPAKKSEISNVLVSGFELINQDDLRIILAGLKKINFEPTEAALKNLSLIGFDDTKSVETSVLGVKGISSGDTLDRTTANDALDESVTIRISFDVATINNDSKHWALVEKTNADDIHIAIAQGQENWIFGGKLEQGITPQWSFVCKKPLQLTDRQETLRLSISNLKTNLLSGYANLYVHYENFPGYWDGFITVPIHKGPLVYRECKDANNVKIGCVGIGTDEPTAKLHVKSSSGVVGLKVEGDAEITGNFSAGNLSMGQLGIGTSDLGDNKLKVQGNTAIAGDLTVTNGKVGIATTNPRIHLALGDNDTGLNQEGDGKLAIYTNNTERIRIVENGNVGIGTDNPQAKLHVNGGIYVTSSSEHLKLARSSGGEIGSQLFLELFQENQGGSNPCIRFHNGGNFWHRIEAASDGFHFRDGALSSGSYRSVNTGSMTVNGSLQVKDGQGGLKLDFNTDTASLDVAGSVGVKGSFYVWDDNKWKRYKRVNLDADNFPSDLQLKREIYPVTKILSKLEKLNPVSFYWKDAEYFLEDYDKLDASFLRAQDIEAENQQREKDRAKLTRQQFGFVAQEVEAIFPDWVSTGDDGYKRLNLRMLPPLLVQAVQELKQHYDELIMENRTLQKRLEKLERDS